MAVRHNRQTDRPRRQSPLRHSGRRKDPEDRGHGRVNSISIQTIHSTHQRPRSHEAANPRYRGGVIISSTSPSQPRPTRLRPITPPRRGSSMSPTKAGITVRNVNGSVESKRYIIEATGSGVAILDYDRDGWPDIFLVNGTDLSPRATAIATKQAKPSNHLFHNNHDGTFTDVTVKAGLVSTGWGQGPALETMTTTDSTTSTSPATAKTASSTTRAMEHSRR